MMALRHLAGDQFYFEEPPRALRQRVFVDVIDLAVVCGDAR
jgi:hypothetical protein